MITKLAARVALVLALTAVDLGPNSAPTQAQGVQRERLSAELDRLAARLSLFLAESQARAALLGRVEGAKEKVVSLREALGATLAQGPGIDADGILGLVAQVQRIEATLERAGAPVPRLDLKLPLRAHHGQLVSADKVYVLAAPLAEESEVSTLTAFSGAERVTLDPKDPPTVPTLVVVPGERESLEPSYPLPTAAEPGDEENPRRVDDFVGVARIKITDDHESWASGNPEIYVQIARTQTGSGIINSVALPAVDDENVWYVLADPNSTYMFYDSTVDPMTTIAVWEEDNFAHGADDFLGSVTIDWTALPFSGYTIFGNGDMQIRIDRD